MIFPPLNPPQWGVRAIDNVLVRLSVSDGFVRLTFREELETAGFAQGMQGFLYPQGKGSVAASRLDRKAFSLLFEGANDWLC